MTRQDRCAACHRKNLDGSKYCTHHGQALQSIKDHHRAWSDAYGKISWLEFLDRVSEMDETGSWVKEVIKVEKAVITGKT
jgi:hypothetical protein